MILHNIHIDVMYGTILVNQHQGSNLSVPHMGFNLTRM